MAQSRHAYEAYRTFKSAGSAAKRRHGPASNASRGTPYLPPRPIRTSTMCQSRQFAHGMAWNRSLEALSLSASTYDGCNSLHSPFPSSWGDKSIVEKCARERKVGVAITLVASDDSGVVTRQTARFSSGPPQSATEAE